MIGRVNTGQMVAQTQRVLLAHAEIIRLVLRRFFEMFGGQREEPSRVSRVRDAPLRTTLSAHSNVNGNVISR